METRYIVGLAVGFFIYIAAVSGLYLVFKDDIAYQREQFRKAKLKRKNAKEIMLKAKSLDAADLKTKEINEDEKDH